jgi:hypothetical protein
MKIKIKFRQDDYKASYKVKLSETEKEKYKKNPISYCFNKMMAFLSTEYSFDWDKITNLEKAVYKQTLGRNFNNFTKFDGEEDLLITVEHKEDSQVIFAVNFDKDAALYWVNYVRAFLKTYKVDYDI